MSDSEIKVPDIIGQCHYLNDIAQKTQEIPGFFACLGVKKVQGFSVDTKPPFFQSCRTRTCVNTSLRAIRALDQKNFFTDFGGTPLTETTKY